MTRLLGPHNMELAEDVAQEALECAAGVKVRRTQNPTAWLT
jgi:DNA-directed RNA polymerase specialized sigma24 family protein